MRDGSGKRDGGNRKLAGSGPLNPRVLLAIIVVLAAGLVFFYMFSAPYGDGLENTMEEGEAEEGEPAHQAPLDYGDDYGSTLLMGLVGLTVMILLVYGLGRALPDRSDEADGGKNDGAGKGRGNGKGRRGNAGRDG